jgi:hypothetical protein
MINNSIVNVRIVQKHDLETNWNTLKNFIPLKGEIIIYEADENYNYSRIKVGDGETLVSELAFITDDIYNIIQTYILNVDYSPLEFDTSEIVFGTNTSSILGQAILGQLILA